MEGKLGNLKKEQANFRLGGLTTKTCGTRMKETVYTFGHPTLNVEPQEAEQLFEPDLAGFEVGTTGPVDKQR